VLPERALPPSYVRFVSLRCLGEAEPAEPTHTLHREITVSMLFGFPFASRWHR